MYAFNKWKIHLKMNLVPKTVQVNSLCSWVMYLSAKPTKLSKDEIEFLSQFLDEAAI